MSIVEKKQYKYLSRKIDKELLEWKDSLHRKPLLLRGARQVGKSSSIRNLGHQFEHFLEINLEKSDEGLDIKAVFERSKNPKQICEDLSVLFATPIIPGRTLLFIDEIQSSTSAISSLRYFYEEIPELHIIAAGSLLEFALQEIPSFGVGRIRSLFMYPFSFDEYLRVIGFESLADAISNASPSSPLSEAVHKKAIQLLIKFILIGGMPEVVAAYRQGVSLLDCQQILTDLILTLSDDFAKYKQKVPSLRLREIFDSIIKQTGSKFIYSNASQDTNFGQIKECVSLLEKAGLIIPVIHTSANGLPLGAEQNAKFCKYLILDTGIHQRQLNLDISSFLSTQTLEHINKGSLAELFVGLELIKNYSSSMPTQLHYWHREQKGSNAEVDYVIQMGQEVVPIEVKSGTKGSMQSMFLFLKEKQSNYGIRCSMENFAKMKEIQIYPLYAIKNIVSKVV